MREENIMKIQYFLIEKESTNKKIWGMAHDETNIYLFWGRQSKKGEDRSLKIKRAHYISLWQKRSILKKIDDTMVRKLKTRYHMIEPETVNDHSWDFQNRLMNEILLDKLSG